jgi:hypothetical protein
VTPNGKSLLNIDDGKTHRGVIMFVGADGLALKGCARGRNSAQSKVTRRLSI